MILFASRWKDRDYKCWPKSHDLSRLVHQRIHEIILSCSLFSRHLTKVAKGNQMVRISRQQVLSKLPVCYGQWQSYRCNNHFNFLSSWMILASLSMHIQTLFKVKASLTVTTLNANVGLNTAKIPVIYYYST